MTALVTIAGLSYVNWPATNPTPAIAEPVRQIAAPVAVPTPVFAIPEIAGSGYVVAAQTTDVFAKYGGVLETLTVDLGDFVSAGQVIATFDDPNARFALEQAEAAKVSATLALNAADITLAQAQDIAERTAALVARGAASTLQMTQATSALHSAQNARAQADQNIALADLAIRVAEEPVAALTLRAPISGTVTQLNATVGDRLLGRADGRNLLVLTNTDTLVIDADVAETNIALLHTGQRGEAVLDGFPDAPFDITLARIAPEVSAAKGTVTLRLTFTDPPAGIRPNMAARIRISTPATVTH